MSYQVYILYSSKLSQFYKGYTSNIVNRIKYHNSGFEKFTKKGSPWELVWCTTKSTRQEAIQLERKLKNLSHTRLISFFKKYNENLTPFGKSFPSGFEP